MWWIREKVIDLYGKSIGEHICNLTIPHNDRNDNLSWIQNPDGFYTSKSAYSWLSLKFQSSQTFLENHLEAQNAPNKMVFQGKEDPAIMVWERKPPKEFVKVNVDAAILDGYVGYGVIARDANGFALSSCYGFNDKTLDVIWVELKALSVGMKLAKTMKISKLIVESDNVTLINIVNKGENDITILGRCANKECTILRNFDSIRFNWVDRRSNVVADLLSKLAIKNKCNLNFNMDYPMEIHNLIISEAIK
ncbi:hypothetical protein CXB51_001596 [Gossypium anomalum]|uniref:RNase H type-1 domain-containing protein n=1 Tax=Gossypium anomalum TaxID=47600 RepID=A0A8J6DCC0_9ROSI|nr:hypothetical protein CXB51_001596 [Gossypium anomalum]